MSESGARSGYEILQVYALEQHYEVVDAPAEEEAADGEAPLGVSWDWRVLEGPNFEVQLGIEMPPTKELHELVRVRFVLRARAGTNLSVPPRDFVCGPAIALLIPYIREAITSMSVRGPIGVRYLNPLNAHGLAAQFDFEQSRGASQLAENSELTALYGSRREVQSGSDGD